MNKTIINKMPDVNKGRPQTSVKEMFIISSVSVFCTIVVYKTVQWFKHKPNNPTSKSDTNYVYFSTEGQTIVLSEQKVYGIVQMYEDGVMPSVIATKYNVNSVMVCRIVNSLIKRKNETNNKQNFRNR